MLKDSATRCPRGFTIVEIITGVAIFAIIAVIVTVNVQKTGTVLSDQERIDEAAFNLDQLARAIAFFEPTKPPVSFRYTVGVYPGKLSQLTAPLSITQKNDCGAVFTAGQVTAWKGGYFLREIPTSNFKIVDGFIASDSLVRQPANANAGLAGVLSIVIPNVERADAVRLGLVVDNDSTGTFGTTRFTLNGNLPVTLTYRMEIAGC